jgi:hypothetical protein
MTRRTSRLAGVARRKRNQLSLQSVVIDDQKLRRAARRVRLRCGLEMD